MAVLNGDELAVLALVIVFHSLKLAKPLAFGIRPFLFLAPQREYNEGLVCEEGLHAMVSCFVMAPCPLLVVVFFAWLTLCSVDVVVSVAFNYLYTVHCGFIQD